MLHRAAFVALATVVTFACDTEPSSPDLADRGVAVDVDPDSFEATPDQRRRHGPIEVALLHRAMQGDVLDEEQLEHLIGPVEALRAHHEHTRSAHDELRRALQSAAAAGEVTESTVSDQLAQLEQAAADEAGAIEAALETLHQVTTREQRQTLLEDLPVGPPPNRNGKESIRPDEVDHTRPPGPASPPRIVAEALALDDDQVLALKDVVGQPPPPPSKGDDRLASFSDDDFEVGSLGLSSHHPARVRTRAESMVELVAAVLPLLDDDQHGALLAWLSSAPRQHEASGVVGYPRDSE